MNFTACVMMALLGQQKRFEALDISFYLRDVFETTNYDIVKTKSKKDKKDDGMVETTVGPIVRTIELHTYQILNLPLIFAIFKCPYLPKWSKVE